MKVCILTERMRLGFGVDLVVDQQAKRLVKLGFEVIVVVSHADLVQPRRDYQLVVINRVIPTADYSSAAAMQRILAVLKISGVDLWILHTPPYYDWARYLKEPAILIEYGAPPGHFFAPALGQQIDAAVNVRLHQLYAMLKPSDAIMSISHSIHEWLPKTAQRQSTVIHLGCDHYPRASQRDAEDLRLSLGLKPADCMILWVGRMQLENDEQPYKGFPYLLRLLPLVRQVAEDAKFVLAGRVSAADKAKLESSGLSVLANLTSEQMSTAYAAADVLINLSRWEGFNLALLEAQFQGTPVIAYDVGPHCEIVTRNETGLLAPTPQDFYRSVVQIAGDRPLREKLSQQAERFAAGFTWDKSVAELARLITDCTSRAPRPDLEVETVAERPDAPVVKADEPERDVEATSQTEGDTPANARSRSGPRTSGIQVPIFRLSSLRRLLASLGMRKSVRLLPPEALPTFDTLLNVGRPLPFSRWFQLEDDAFVRLAYRILLGRDATERAVEYWEARLRNGDSRSRILATIRSSYEGVGRRLSDPDLREILFRELFKQVPIFRRPEREGLARQIRRIDSRQRAIEADFRRLNELLEPPDFAAGARSPILMEPSADPQPDGKGEPALYKTLWYEIGSTHTAVVAPGVTLAPDALARLAEASLSAESDILIGDEIERMGAPPFERLRRRGPFSHEAFLRAPELGGVIGVHNSLLKALNLPRTVVLTGGIGLRLVALAHTITYVDATLSSRSSGAMKANRPGSSDVRSYLDRIQRSSIVDLVDNGYDVRFPVKARWKAALIIVSSPDDEDQALERTIEGLLTHTPAEQFWWLAARPADAPRNAGGHQRILEFPKDAQYGLMVNEAVKRAPAECDLIVVMDSGVLPTTPDWLERLAETAFSPGTGVVAPRTMYPDGRIRHAGMALGIGGEPCGYVARLEQLQEDGGVPKKGLFEHLTGLREVSVASRHCMVFRRAIFADQRGFAVGLGRDAADIDFCLRLRTVGWSNFVDGRVAMVQNESIPRWGREFSAAELQGLVERHRRKFSDEDAFWMPAEGDPKETIDIRTVRLAPVEDR